MKYRMLRDTLEATPFTLDGWQYFAVKDVDFNVRIFESETFLFFVEPIVEAQQKAPEPVKTKEKSLEPRNATPKKQGVNIKSPVSQAILELLGKGPL